jgi:hypothetical protein
MVLQTLVFPGVWRRMRVCLVRLLGPTIEPSSSVRRPGVSA